MPRAATVLREGADDAPVERRPGEFARHAKTGAPYVTDPERLTDAGLKKAQLVELAAKHGIEVPDKATVPQLKAALGDLAKRGTRVQYGRPSGLGKQIENTTNLQKWAERAVALGLFHDLMEHHIENESFCKELANLDPEQWSLDDDEAKDLLDDIAVKAKNLAQAGIAAERGTHEHAALQDVDEGLDPIERLQHGEQLGIPVDVGQALVDAWERMLRIYGFEILAVEASCVDDIWRQAGTLDRIVRLTRDIRFVLATGEIVIVPGGTVLILDIKTGKLRLDDAGFVSFWHAYSVQCASYAQSRPYDPDTDTRGDWPFEIDQRWAIIAHLDILAALDGEAKCRLVLVDLEAGRHAGALCVAAREWEKRCDVFSIPTDDLAVSVPVESSSAGVLDGDVEAQSADPPAEEPPAAAAPAAAQPAPEGTAPSGAPTAAPGDGAAACHRVLSDDEVRAAYFDLDEDQRREVARLRDEHIATERNAGRLVTKRDATALAIGWVKPFDVELPPQPAPAPKPLPERSLRFDGDEGEPISASEVAEARRWIEQLGDDYGPVHAIGRQAHGAGLSFHIVNHPTRRRWQIYRGLAALGRYGWSESVARDLLAAATDDPACCQPAIPLGQIVGLLDVAQATAFADMAAALAFTPAGELVGAAT